MKSDHQNFEKENKRILRENVMLIQEINHLKTELHLLQQQTEYEISTTPLDDAKPLPRSLRVKSAHPSLVGKEINNKKKEAFI